MIPVDIPGQSSNVDLGGARGSLTPGPHLVTSLLLISPLLLNMILGFTFLEPGGRHRARTFLGWPCFIFSSLLPVLFLGSVSASGSAGV